MNMLFVAVYGYGSRVKKRSEMLGNAIMKMAYIVHPIMLFRTIRYKLYVRASYPMLRRIEVIRKCNAL